MARCSRVAAYCCACRFRYRAAVKDLAHLSLHGPNLHEFGLSSVRRIPMDNPFKSLYELTP